jgi:hypothetical protein
VWSKLEEEMKQILLREFDLLYVRCKSTPRMNMRGSLERVACTLKMKFEELLSVWTVYRQNKGGKQRTPALGSVIAKASKVGKEYIPVMPLYESVPTQHENVKIYPHPSVML